MRAGNRALQKAGGKVPYLDESQLARLVAYLTHLAMCMQKEPFRSFPAPEHGSYIVRRVGQVRVIIKVGVGNVSALVAHACSSILSRPETRRLWLGG